MNVMNSVSNMIDITIGISSMSICISCYTLYYLYYIHSEMNDKMKQLEHSHINYWIHKYD
jgi:hypothetical protein